MPRLLHELAVGRGGGSYARLLARLAKLDLLAIEDWMLAPLRDTERRLHPRSLGVSRARQTPHGTPSTSIPWTASRALASSSAYSGSSRRAVVTDA